MSSLSVGSIRTEIYTVGENQTAYKVGSGGLNVLGTPVLVTWVEQIAYNFIQENLPEEFTSVGSKFEIKHMAPSPVYSNVAIEVKLEEVEGDTYKFSFEAHDQAVIVAKGKHTRVIINTEKFLEKLAKRK